MAEIAAIVLAAGSGSRFAATPGQSKLTAAFAGQPLVRHVIDAAIASRSHPTIVVLGHLADQVRAALDGRPVRFVTNADHRDGMASSLKAGVAALPETVSGAVILLADMPLVSSQTIDSLIERFEDEQGCVDAIVPVYKGVNGNPVLLGRALFGLVATLDGDAGARVLLAHAGRRVAYCEVKSWEIAIDVDTPDALQALAKSVPLSRG